MKSIRLATIALLVMSVVPAAVSAAPAPTASSPVASKLSIVGSRATAKAGKSNKAVGESPLISTLALAGAIVGILAVSGAIGQGSPTSR